MAWTQPLAIGRQRHTHCHVVRIVVVDAPAQHQIAWKKMCAAVLGGGVKNAYGRHERNGRKR